MLIMQIIADVYTNVYLTIVNVQINITLSELWQLINLMNARLSIKDGIV